MGVVPSGTLLVLGELFLHPVEDVLGHQSWYRHGDPLLARTPAIALAWAYWQEGRLALDRWHHPRAIDVGRARKGGILSIPRTLATFQRGLPVAVAICACVSRSATAWMVTPASRYHANIC